MYLYTFHILLIYIREDKILQIIIYLWKKELNKIIQFIF